jgi:hypothetical protein
MLKIWDVGVLRMLLFGIHAIVVEENKTIDKYWNISWTGF